MTRVVASLMTLILLSACSFPGMRVDIDEEQEATWFSSGDPRDADAGEQVTPEYDATVERITPQLINRLRQKPGQAASTFMNRPPPPAGSGQYEVGPGDLLAIIVYGHPDLTNPAGTTQNFESSGRLVDSEGMIYVPFLGRIEVAGKTPNHIRREVTEGLSEVIRDPQIDVKVLEYRSKKVIVTGDISRPCTIPVRDIPLTVAEALDRCQSLLSERDPGTSGVNAVQLVRNDTVYPLNLSMLYRSGGDRVRLQDGDHLIVDDSFNRVFLLGEFDEQLATPFSAGGMTLSDAMAAAGGLNLASADASRIYVIRGFVKQHQEPGQQVQTTLEPHVFHLDASSVEALLLADQFQLQPRDIVYAAPASLVNFNRALSQIAPSLNLLFQSALIYDRVDDR